ncbi:sensor domain-containing protein [Halorubellus sp. PRR65]|uniref:sensor domain-containing protein n=1 Tax=Halorubellus sp. PRR65 TaxID=3098148 RepID=UPI002B25EBFE|nr:sensor domain-containing protein [Halorubellus sp. PRR65]
MANEQTAHGRRSLLAAPLDPFTYRTLGYLVLAAPIGLAYTVLLSVGFGLSVGLSITPLGPVVVVATLLSVVALAWADAHLTGGLLGVDVTPRLPAVDQGVVDFLKELAVGRATWTSVAFLAYRAVLGVVAFVVLVTGVTTTAAFLLAPFAYGDALVLGTTTSYVFVDTLAESLLVAAAGVLTGLGTLYATNLLGRASAHVTDALFADA